jgi:hypothetical protein
VAFNIALIKEHPYATGAIVIVGGLVAFYLLSGSSSSSAASSSGGSEAAVLQADEALAQTQAGTSQANAQLQAQTQVAQSQQEETDEQTQASLNAANTQTAAQLAASIYGTQAGVETTQLNDTAATTQAANEAIFNQNTVAEQDSVLEDQINSQIVENANNNATSVANTQIGAGLTDTALQLGTDVAEQQDTENYGLQTQQNTAYDAEIPYIVANAGDQKNSLIDATDQTSLFQTILAQGNPGVAAAGTGATASADKVAGGVQTAQTTSIAGGVSSIVNGLLG